MTFWGVGDIQRQVLDEDVSCFWVISPPSPPSPSLRGVGLSLVLRTGHATKGWDYSKTDGNGSAVSSSTINNNTAVVGVGM